MSCGQTLVQAQDRPVVLSQVQRPAVVQQTAPVTAVTGAGAQTLVDHVRPTAVAVDRPAHYPVEVVTRGPKGDKGDPGAQGPPGPTGGEALERTADTALGGHRAVRSTGVVSVGYASCADASQGDDVLGITLGAAPPGGAVLVQTGGELTEPSWSWAPQEPIYLGLDGGLTQLQPMPPSAAFVLPVGFATSATSMVIRFDDPVYFED